jgi:hypothetical protein
MLAQAQCPHGAGKVAFLSSATKVLIQSGLPLVVGDKGTVAGCPFTIPLSKPQPCVTALVPMTAIKVLIENKPAVLKGPADMCQSAEQIPQGPVAYANFQTKVLAT